MDEKDQISEEREVAGSCLYCVEDESVDIGRGCRFIQNESDEMDAEILPGCFKLHTTDWLEDYPDNTTTDIFEVRFKNTHRGYYRNVYNLPLSKGDIVAVEASPGHDIGIISLTGDMVSKQMRRVGFNPQNGEFRKIYRKAKPYDIERWQEAIALEHSTMIRSRQIAAEMNLNMKIGDVEYQGDKIKAIFYYIADERVDFRELIKVFAEQFHIRVEMKQIGARQEAARIGGLGSCGRQLCCASWISSFVSVTTNAAHVQDLSLNPQKLAGQCSKLKCCLIYELDSYLDSRQDFPRLNGPLQTMEADYFLVKSDILAKTMSFSTTPGSLVGMITVPVSRVREILRMNQKGEKPDRLESKSARSNAQEEPGFVNVIGEESITRFDSAKSGKKRKHRGDRSQKDSKDTAQATQADSSAGQNQADAGAQQPAERRSRNDRRKGKPQGGERKTESGSHDQTAGKESDGGQSNAAPQQNGQRKESRRQPRDRNRDARPRREGEGAPERNDASASAEGKRSETPKQPKERGNGGAGQTAGEGNAEAGAQRHGQGRPHGQRHRGGHSPKQGTTGGNGGGNESGN